MAEGWVIIARITSDIIFYNPWRKLRTAENVRALHLLLRHVILLAILNELLMTRE